MNRWRTFIAPGVLGGEYYFSKRDEELTIRIDLLGDQHVAVRVVANAKPGQALSFIGTEDKYEWIEDDIELEMLRGKADPIDRSVDLLHDTRLCNGRQVHILHTKTESWSNEYHDPDVTPGSIRIRW